MIIANGLKRLFSGAVADCTFLGNPQPNTPIQFWFGDQKELIEWITQRKNLDNYPLVWYVLNEYTEFQGWYETNARLVIMQDTQLKQLNDWRTQNSYEGVLEPVWYVIKERLETNLFIDVVSQNKKDKFKLQCVPNYGVDLNQPNNFANDFTRSAEKSTKGISIDLVDCLVVDFKLRIKAKCII